MTELTEQEKVISKIRKVKALADRAGTEGEAMAALCKLQNLLAKHNMTVADITGESAEATQTVDTLVVDQMGRQVHYRGWLAHVIAEYFRCRTYYAHVYAAKGRSVRLEMVGMSNDVLAAQAAYGAAILALNRLWTKHSRERVKQAYGDGGTWDSKRGAAAGKAYIAGFISGLSETLRENANRMALVLVRDKKVDDFVATLRLSSGGASSANYIQDYESRAAGQRDGRAYGQEARTSKLGTGVKAALKT